MKRHGLRTAALWLAVMLISVSLFGCAVPMQVPAAAEVATPAAAESSDEQEQAEEALSEASEEESPDTDVDEAEAEEEYEEVFAEWNEYAPALNALIDYVEAVTDEESPDYIPPVDRIAVFDMDGTLMGELYPTYLEYYMLAWRILKDPSITPDEEMLEVGRT